MDVTQLITAFPNLAFGLICLWFVQVVWKERVGELARYTTSLEAINKLYVELLERTVIAIVNGTSQSSDNGQSLTRLIDEFAAFRRDILARHDAIDRFIHDSTKRDGTNRAGSRTTTGTD